MDLVFSVLDKVKNQLLDQDIDVEIVKSVIQNFYSNSNLTGKHFL